MRSSPFHTQARRGFSLIEMMTAMAILSVILTMATLVIFQLQRLTLSEANETDHSVAFVDFARIFRTDMHRATAAEVSEDEQFLTLTASETASEKAISYRVAESYLIREASGQPVHRVPIEDYDLRWLVADSIVRLTLEPKTIGIGQPWQFDAAIGLVSLDAALTEPATPEGDGS